MPVPTYHVQGGFENAAIYSGQVAPGLTAAVGAVAVGSDVLLQSGPGRLWALIPHQSFLSLSGLQIPFYDAGAPISGGPIYASGHVPLAFFAAGGGVSGQLSFAGVPQYFPGGVPFNSGLCLNSRSGQCGVTAVWSKEANLPVTN